MKNLINGSPLIVEELDLSEFGLYIEKDPAIPDENYALFGYTSFGKPLWYRKSEEGKKYHIYDASELRDWSKLEPIEVIPKAVKALQQALTEGISITKTTKEVE